MPATDPARVKVAIRNLYKIFGPDPQTALTLVREGMGKNELLDHHNHTLGLNDINVDIREGEITVIMGLSGSGKSTLIRHLNRLIEPTAGEVLLDGENVLTYGPADLRRLRQEKMSMVFQKFALLPHRTVLQNAGMSRRIRGEDQDTADREGGKWLDRVGLAGVEAQYPHQLSGGMQQRVGIARALASDSDIMLMDEAFSALDPLIRSDMQGLLLELQKDLHKTIVFITHDLDEALRLADHLVILKDGFVVQQGEPQHILLYPSDPYIEAFVGEINRARVLRVRSIMQRCPDVPPAFSGVVSPDATLEELIEMSGGNTECCYNVQQDGADLGILDMQHLVRALVPARPGEDKLAAQ
ncbi:glycine/betaine ABC transporter [Pseudoruegeria sp. SK021]|nr:glycine/betaine ABC transporter [Pseudoruegeria sp. SK021]